MTRIKTGKFIKCKICNKEFYVIKARLEKGKAKFCSRACLAISNKGKQVSPETRFKKGPGFWLGKKRKPFSKEWRRRMSESRMGSKHWRWKGGRFIQSGYVFLLRPNHPFCDRHGYVREHRLVMEKHLGRYLSGSEVVHHCGDKNDNTIHKLICFTSNRAHIRFHKNPLNVNLEEIICDGRKIIIPLAGNL